uniref:Uncharacterized protein n=1 Tax=Anguilla anguilla TaxID=7936 RepID=A0A0E9XSU7_ANGAN
MSTENLTNQKPESPECAV